MIGLKFCRPPRRDYDSGPSALAFYGLIPEYTPLTFSLATGHPERLAVPQGELVSLLSWRRCSAPGP